MRHANVATLATNSPAIYARQMRTGISHV